jgi:hypothetical protein
VVVVPREVFDGEFSCGGESVYGGGWYGNVEVTVEFYGFVTQGVESWFVAPFVLEFIWVVEGM